MYNRKGTNQHKARRHLHLWGQRSGSGRELTYYLALVTVLVIIGLVTKAVREKQAWLYDSLSLQAHAMGFSSVKPVPNFKDQRAKQVYAYLDNYNSPLTKYAEYIVAMADKYAIDYTLVAAIAGKESSFGKATEAGSYNAWGYMEWTNGDRHLRHFDSWEDGVEAESMLLSDHYRLNANQAIGAKYCPAYECSSTWAEDVTNFANSIREGVND